MGRSPERPFLIGLLVLLVLSMGTCPCVIKQAVAERDSGNPIPGSKK